jgi:hypothetical protein
MGSIFSIVSAPASKARRPRTINEKHQNNPPKSAIVMRIDDIIAVVGKS